MPACASRLMGGADVTGRAGMFGRPGPNGALRGKYVGGFVLRAMRALFANVRRAGCADNAGFPRKHGIFYPVGKIPTDSDGAYFAQVQAR